MTAGYDVMILGTGEAGIYAAYELALKCPGARVLVVDRGADKGFCSLFSFSPQKVTEL